MRWFHFTNDPDDIRPGLTIVKQSYRKPTAFELHEHKDAATGEIVLTQVAKPEAPMRIKTIYVVRLLADIPIPFWRRDFEIDYRTKVLLNSRVRGWARLEFSNFRPWIEWACGISPPEPSAADVIVSHPRLDGVHRARAARGTPPNLVR